MASGAESSVKVDKAGEDLDEDDISLLRVIMDGDLEGMATFFDLNIFLHNSPKR